MRAASTYRGARRNAARDRNTDFLPEATVETLPVDRPYQSRGKQYPAGWRTKAERAAGPRT